MKKIISHQRGSLSLYSLTRNSTVILEGRNAFVPFWRWGYQLDEFEAGKQRLQGNGYSLQIMSDLIEFRWHAFGFAASFQDKQLLSHLRALEGHTHITDANSDSVVHGIERIIVLCRIHMQDLQRGRLFLYLVMEELWPSVSKTPFDRLFLEDTLIIPALRRARVESALSRSESVPVVHDNVDSEPNVGAYEPVLPVSRSASGLMTEKNSSLYPALVLAEDGDDLTSDSEQSEVEESSK